MHLLATAAAALTAGTLVAATPAHVVMVKRQDCQPNYSSCAPSGATTSALPPVGTALANLYNDLLNSAKGAGSSQSSKREVGARGLAARDAPGMCCAFSSKQGLDSRLTMAT